MLVLQGDGTDEELLADENVGSMDMFLALTSDDEDNILAAMLAKRLGARRVLSLINRRAYADMMQGSAIDIAVSPSHASSVNCWPMCAAATWWPCTACGGGAAEALEGVVRGDAKTSKLVGRSVDHVDAALPAGVRLGIVVQGEGRERRVLMPERDLLIEAGDHLVIFIPDKRKVRDVERLFQVSATFF